MSEPTQAPNYATVAHDAALPEDLEYAVFLAAMRGAAGFPQATRGQLPKRNLDTITEWAARTRVNMAILALIADGAALPFIDRENGELTFHFIDGNQPAPWAEKPLTLSGFGPETDGELTVI
jgi:hypothetical protein